MHTWLLVLVGVVLVVGVPVDRQPNGEEFQYILRNISALWEEVKDIRHEVDYHLHHGQSDSRHNLAQILEEVQVLQHEHHVHRLHHPHEGHQHNSTLFQHLEKFHSYEHPHGQGNLSRGSHADHVDQHDLGAPSLDQSYHHDNEHGALDFHDFHGLRANAQKHDLNDAHLYESDHYEQDPNDPRDPWIHATCQLEPNVDLPESNVRGSIHISRRRDGWGGVFFDIDVEGFDQTKGGHIYSFHVHERPLKGKHCNDVGGFLKPSLYPGDHLGNLGDLTLNSNGKFDHALIASLDVDIEGEKNIVGYPIVVHDAGFSDPSSSLYNGRLACCNIHMIPEVLTNTSGN